MYDDEKFVEETDYGMEDEMNEDMNYKETDSDVPTGGGVQVLEITPATRVYVQNTENAETLFNIIFNNMTSIEKLLSEASDLDVKHLPVDLSSGRFLSEGDFLNIARLSPCKIEMDPNEDNFKLISYLSEVEVPKKDPEEETVKKPFYVYSLHIMGSIVIQTYSDNTQDYIFFKQLSKDNIVMLHVG